MVISSAWIDTKVVHLSQTSRSSHRGEIIAGKVLEKKRWIVAEQRIPVMAQVELWIVAPGVTFVDADQPSVSRVVCEKAACIVTF